ncbi:hypothetical protein F4Y59_14185 [Candidatus Poribacteria bacterium]|nr:hypothetical protein [Candidatus Poribacteria bacterium]
MMRKKETHYALGLAFLFLAIGAYTTSHHEMWRDEIQAWLLARDSASVFELFAHLKYEGHPGIWHLCLMPLTRITHSPVIMQVFHLLIATGTVYLFVRYAPFNRFQKFLFCFGYFVLYEYAVLARNYALGLLLIIVFCILFSERYRRFIWIGCVLFFLSHTSVHALILTITIGFALCCEYLYRNWLSKPLAEEIEAIGDKKSIWIGFALIGIGIITAVLQLNPPADTGFAVEWRFAYDSTEFSNVIKLISRALLPIPEFSLNFWNKHQLETYNLFQAIQIPLCCLLILCSIFLLLKRPTALLIYLMATFGLLVFFYIKYYGSMRHHGFLFITFLMIAWIYRDCPEITLPFKSLSALSQRLFSSFVTFIFVCQFIGGITTVILEDRYVFSYGKQVAEYIKAEDMQDMTIVGEGDYAASTSVVYIEKDEIYYVHGSRFGSFVRWDDVRMPDVDIPDDQVLKEASILRTQTAQDLLIIMNRSLDPELRAQHNLTFLTQFTGSIVDDEGFYLYLMPIP